MNRKAWFLLLKIKVKGFSFVLPVFFPVLFYLCSLIRDCGIWVPARSRMQDWCPGGKVSRAADNLRSLLEELRSYGRLELVDVDAREAEERVAVSLTLW